MPSVIITNRNTGKISDEFTRLEDLTSYLEEVAPDENYSNLFATIKNPFDEYLADEEVSVGDAQTELELVDSLENEYIEESAYRAWIDLEGIHSVDPDRFNEAYAGQYESDEEFAEELWGQIVEIPSNLADYIDWRKVASDLMEYDFNTYDGFYFHANI